MTHNTVYMTDNNSGEFVELSIDDGSIATIPHEHIQVHEGRLHFVSTTFSGVSNSASVYMGWTVGSLPQHTGIQIVAGGSVQTYLYEDAVFSGGNTLSCVNKNRINQVNTEDVFVSTPTITDVGSILGSQYLAGGTSPQTRVGGTLRTYDEWILKPDTNYLIRAINNSGGAIVIDISVGFYNEELTGE